MSYILKRLSDCNIGREYIVLNVNAGFRAKSRLANLGIIPGEKIIKIRSAPFRGPIEVIIKGSKLVIGRGLATRIIVRE
ncbi:MAG: ferrous iron transport protein A [Candidatus Thorarchaeota archaeon]